MMTSMGLRFSPSPAFEARSNQYLGLEAAGEIRGRWRDPFMSYDVASEAWETYSVDVRYPRTRRRTLLRLCRPETVDNRSR